MPLTGPHGLMGIVHGMGRRLAWWAPRLGRLVQRGRNITCRRMFVFLNMFPLNQPEVMIPYADDKFDDEGNLTETETSPAFT